MRHYEPAQIEADFLSRLAEMSEKDRNNARWLLENINGIATREMLNGIPDAHHNTIMVVKTALKAAQTEEN